MFRKENTHFGCHFSEQMLVITIKHWSLSALNLSCCIKKAACWKDVHGLFYRATL